MFTVLKQDAQFFIKNLKVQDAAFYLGLFYIVLYYLRPQYIYSSLLIIPWLQLTILFGLFVLLSKSNLVFTRQHFFLLLFAIICWFSVQASQYPIISKKEQWTAFIFFLEVLFLSNCVRNTTQFKILLIVFFICVFKMSFFGARVWASRGFGFSAWGIQGPPGFFQNSGEYTLLMAIVAVMSIPFLIALRPKTKIYWFLPITAVMAAIGASSRGGQLALVIGLLFLLLSYRRLKIKHLVYIALSASLVWSLIPDQQKARFESAGSDKTSTARLKYWEAGLDMTLKNPWLGVGHGAFPQHYDLFYKHDDGSFLMSRQEVAHNSLVQVSSTLGIPALIIYLIFHYFVYRRVKIPKNKRYVGDVDIVFMDNIKIALRASVIVYFVGAFFMSVAFYPYIYFLLSLSIIYDHVERLSYERKPSRTLKEISHFS